MTCTIPQRGSSSAPGFRECGTILPGGSATVPAGSRRPVCEAASRPASSDRLLACSERSPTSRVHPHDPTWRPTVMKILHVSPGYFPVVGGSEVHIQELSKGLARRGHDVTFLTPHETVPGGTARSESINGVRVLRFAEASAFRRLLELPGA